MTSLELLAWLCAVAVVFYFFWPKPKRVAAPRPTVDGLPKNAIVVDGSNVMYWGGEPSQMVLARVLAALRKKDFAPIAIFDASVGYRLGNRFMNEMELAAITGLPDRQILVVNKGIVADEVILDFATEHNLRIVTNDRYRDWATQFPHVKKKGCLVKGTWKEGNVMLPDL
jgi:hypothetical protein